MARNVWRKGTDGRSAYERLHGVSSFTGQMVPFGMGIQFRPTKPNREQLLEFDARAVDGIFLGWDIQPGMTFKGDYVVAAWSDFQALGLDAKVPIHVVREIIVPERIVFPIADAERALGLRLPLPAEQQPGPATEHVEGTDQLPAPIGEASESVEAAGLPYHNIRKYAGSARARFAPWLTSQEWISLGQKGRKQLVDEAVAKEVAADEDEVALAAAHIIEFCTSPDSRMGDPTNTLNGCTVTRLTLDDDLTTDAGYARGEKAVRDNPGALLWGSIPCTGGSPWQNLNGRTVLGRKRVKRYKAVFRKLLRNFARLAEVNASLGGEAALEWPRACAYWRERKVLELIAQLGLEDVFVDGCALGTVAQYGADAGLPILKPWRIATSCQELRDDFRAYRCPGHERHAACAGKNTEATGFYTDEFVQVVHAAYKRHCDALVATTTTPSSLPSTPSKSPANNTAEIHQGVSAALKQLAAAVGVIADAWLHNCVSSMPADSVAALSAAIGNITSGLTMQMQITVWLAPTSLTAVTFACLSGTRWLPRRCTHQTRCRVHACGAGGRRRACRTPQRAGMEGG